MNNEMDRFPLLAVTLSDPKRYVEDYLTNNNIAVTLTGSLVDAEQRPRPLIENALYRAALSDYLDYSNIYRILKLPKVLQFTKALLVDSLDEILFHKRQVQVQALATTLACEQEDLSELRRWVAALNPSHTELDVLKAAHFIWQVKRKLVGKKTKWESLLHIYSRDQGKGKSWAIRHLLTPLQPAVIYSKLTTFCDDRSSASLARNYVAFVDEIDWPTKESGEYLKTIITSPEVSYRPMRTNDVVTITNNVTLITAANRQIYEIINDSSGNRRYHQITVPGDIDHGAINSIDSFRIFKGIDEKLEDGYSTRLGEDLAVELSAMVVKEDIEVFIEDLHLIPTSTNTKRIILDDLFDTYISYCSTNNYKDPMNKKWFARKLNLRGVKTKRIQKGEARYVTIDVDTRCPVADVETKRFFNINSRLDPA